MNPIRLAAALALSGLSLLPATAATASDTPEARDLPDIHIEDVTRFYRIYDAAGGHPTARQLQHDYLDAGTDGLHRLAQLRRVTGEAIAANLAKHPQMYSDARRCMAVLPNVRTRLQAAFRKLRDLYPPAQFPPVTIAVGRGKPVGVADASGVMIGLELLCATNWMNPDVEDRFVHVIAHEYAHVQQALHVPALYDDPKPTVLEESLIEGAAEFTAERISGEVGYANQAASTRGREKRIETAFVADEGKTDLSAWLYNSTLTKPGDLGYWVGYRIVRSFYEHARDKPRAFREILEMKDPKAFLAASHWQPGMHFEPSAARGAP